MRHKKTILLRITIDNYKMIDFSCCSSLIIYSLFIHNYTIQVYKLSCIQVHDTSSYISNLDTGGKTKFHKNKIHMQKYNKKEVSFCSEFLVCVGRAKIL